MRTFEPTWIAVAWAHWRGPVFWRDLQSIYYKTSKLGGVACRMHQAGTKTAAIGATCCEVGNHLG